MQYAIMFFVLYGLQQRIGLLSYIADIALTLTTPNSGKVSGLVNFVALSLRLCVSWCG